MQALLLHTYMMLHVMAQCSYISVALCNHILSTKHEFVCLSVTLKLNKACYRYVSDK